MLDVNKSEKERLSKNNTLKKLLFHKLFQMILQSSKIRVKLSEKRHSLHISNSKNLNITCHKKKLQKIFKQSCFSYSNGREIEVTRFT